MDKKITTQEGATIELLHAAIFPTHFSLQVVRELNRRNIYYRLEELDSRSTAVYVLKHNANETVEAVNEIKKKNKRVRL